MEENRILTILNQLELKSVYEIFNFFRFANFYYKFVKILLRIIYFFINITKKTSYKTKKNLALYKNNFLILEVYRFFYKLVATFNFLVF